MQNFGREIEPVGLRFSSENLDNSSLEVGEEANFNLLEEAYRYIVAAIEARGPQSTEYLQGRELYGQRLLDLWAKRMRKFQDKKQQGIVVTGERYAEASEEMTVHMYDEKYSVFADSEIMNKRDLNIRTKYRYPGGGRLEESFRGRFLDGQLDELKAPRITSYRHLAASMLSDNDVSFNVTLRLNGIYSMSRTEILKGGIVDKREIRHNSMFVVE